MNIFDLRPYQKECIDVIEKTFEKFPAQLIQLPTGAGKTRVFLNWIFKNKYRTLVVAPTREILAQVYKNACEMFGERNVWQSYGRGPMGLKKQQILVVTAASLIYKPDHLYEIEFDAFVFDEAHRAHCPTYRNFIRDYDCYYKIERLLGVTATPERMDKKSLLDIFLILSYDKNILDLIEQGYLCDINAYRHKTKQKLDSNKVRKGDFLASSLRNLDNETRNTILLKVFNEFCTKKRTLIFCVDISHSDSTAKHLRENGFRAESIHSKIPSQERARILNDFRNGKIDVLCNCQLLTEGFDEPSIEALIIARPTCSKSLYCQMIGRGLRLFPGKELCEVHELTDNCYNLCSFDVVLGYEPSEDYYDKFPFQDGISLRERKKTLENIDLRGAKLESEEIDLLKLSDAMLDMPMMAHQRQELEILGYMKYLPPGASLNYSEAAFEIWTQRMYSFYGINR